MYFGFSSRSVVVKRSREEDDDDDNADDDGDDNAGASDGDEDADDENNAAAAAGTNSAASASVALPQPVGGIRTQINGAVYYTDWLKKYALLSSLVCACLTIEFAV